MRWKGAALRTMSRISSRSGVGSRAPSGDTDTLSPGETPHASQDHSLRDSGYYTASGESDCRDHTNQTKRGVQDNIRVAFIFSTRFAQRQVLQPFWPATILKVSSVTLDLANSVQTVVTRSGGLSLDPLIQYHFAQLFGTSFPHKHKVFGNWFEEELYPWLTQVGFGGEPTIRVRAYISYNGQGLSVFLDHPATAVGVARRARTLRSHPNLHPLLHQVRTTARHWPHATCSPPHALGSSTTTTPKPSPCPSRRSCTVLEHVSSSMPTRRHYCPQTTSR